MIKIDVSELDRIEKGIRQYNSIMPQSVANSAFRIATRPMVQKVRSLAPVGSRKSKNGYGTRTGPDYRRGGATRRDVRIKLVPSKVNAGEVTRALIGVSSKKGKVGWRTHFITRGFTDRSGRKHVGNDFLQQAFDASIDSVKAAYGQQMATCFYKWAKKTLPQGRI